MKYVCVHKCQFRGKIVKEGTILDIEDFEFKDQVKSSFETLEQASEEGVTVSAPVAVGIDAANDGDVPPGEETRTFYMGRLESLKVPYNKRAKREELKALFESVVGVPKEITGAK